MATNNTGGKPLKPKTKTFTATSTSTKPQDFNTRTGTASIGAKAKPATKVNAGGKASSGKSMIAPAKPAVKATKVFNGRKVTLLPKKVK